MIEKKDHVRVVSTKDYNPNANNTRYDSNTGEPKHHAKNSFGSGLMWIGESLQRFKKNYPRLSKIIFNYSPSTLFLLAVAAWAAVVVVVVLNVFGFGLPAIIIAASLLSASVAFLISAGVMSVIRWLTNDVFGWSLSNPSESIYENAPDKLELLINNTTQSNNGITITSKGENTITCTHETATGTLSVQGGNRLPKLTLTAQNHEDSGYLEGYMQGEQIFRTLKQMNKTFEKIDLVVKMKQFFGVSLSGDELITHFDKILKTIPEHIVNEMRAKVAGYNKWVRDAKLGKEHQMDFYDYFRLQLLPDIHNFNPFAKPDQPETLIGAEAQSTGCTTIAYKVGEYTCYIRILDWASHDIAGKACIEIERNIEGYRKTSDVAIGLLSGGVSMVTSNNNKQMLTQINVAPVDADQKNHQGMPGAFAIRHMAEQCDSVQHMHNTMINDTLFKGPLSGMHISATDGINTQSFHAFQGGTEATHLIETMDDTRPMVVPNFGHKDGKVYDFHDSSLRLENINRFFNDNPAKDIGVTGDEALDIPLLQQHMAGIMQLDLVNNFESVFAGMYIFNKGKIIAAKAAIDNNYAGYRTLDQMMDLSVAETEEYSSISLNPTTYQEI